MIDDSRAGQARVPRAVRRLLLDALALRDEHAAQLHRRDDDDDDVIEGHAVEIDHHPLALPPPAAPKGFWDAWRASLAALSPAPGRPSPRGSGPHPTRSPPASTN
ncbi:MAG: hypothetical protein ACLP01_23230 [Solirubrobacteraceae bacterium]